MKKRLYKSATDKMLFGVCGGVAEYFGLGIAGVCLRWRDRGIYCRGDRYSR